MEQESEQGYNTAAEPLMTKNVLALPLRRQIESKIAYHTQQIKLCEQALSALTPENERLIDALAKLNLRNY